MAFLLKISLAALFFTIGGLILVYPEGAKDYVAERYPALKDLFDHPVFPEKLGLTTTHFYGIGAFLAVGGLSMLLHSRIGMTVHALVVLLVGSALHLPSGESRISQSVKLVNVVVVSLSILILANSGCCKEKKEEKEKGKEKRKEKEKTLEPQKTCLLYTSDAADE
eukprot:TRINITY_DN10574_c0_g1_i1.p1 TRINITY_DN10574_c0_g1~~TRINITY_DN10574_c0_g1_i1.p1  ORF type:complete len:166 (-),score=59.63 TRINITY_DN10574_c0_g1_i1:57-554(-)